MRDLVTTLDAGTLDKLTPVLELGFHHEQQHQELLLMDIKHVLSRNPLQPVYSGRPSALAAPDQLGWVDVEGGLVEVGHEGDGFCFDNEQPRHRVWLEPYRLADRLVTNGEWLEFMSDNGYRPPRAVALRRLGEGQRRDLARAVLLAASSTACGSSTRCTARSR